MTRFTVTAFSLASVITFSAAAALAQDPSRSVLSEEVVITASRIEKPLSSIPNTVTVIDTAELAQQLSINHDLSSVLGNLMPGFSPSRQKMSNSGETLRGRRPLYLLDGVPQSNPLRNGARDGATVDPAMLERVEVIHGANAIHGMGASGGIINLITKTPTDELEQSIRVDLTSPLEIDSDQLSGGLAYNFANRLSRWDIIFSTSLRRTGIYTDANGLVIGVDGTQGDTMDSTSRDIFFKGGYRDGSQSLHLMVNDFALKGNGEWTVVPGDVQASIPTTAEPGEAEGIPPTNDVRTISLDYRADQLLGHSLHAQLFRQEFSATYGGGTFATFQDAAYGEDLFDQSQNQSDKLGFKLTLARNNLGDLPVNLVWGLDLLRDETQQLLAQTGRVWVPPSEYVNVAPFAQFEFTGIDKLIVTAGVRHEESKLRIDDFVTLANYGSQEVTGGTPSFSQTLNNLGFTYGLTDSLRLFGNISEGSSMPDVGRVLRAIDEPGVEVESFLNLQPVIANNREVGLEYRDHWLKAEVSYYQSNSDYGAYLAPNTDGIFDVMRDRTEMSGLEASAEWFATAMNSFGFAYAQPRGKHDSNKDGKVDADLDGSNITPPRLNIFWNQLWTDNIETRLQASHLMDRSYNTANSETYFRFDGYTLLDLSASWQLGKSVFRTSIQNLTNTDYVTLFSQNRISANPTTSNSHYFNGRGRTLTLSYTHNF